MKVSFFINGPSNRKINIIFESKALENLKIDTYDGFLSQFEFPPPPPLLPNIIIQICSSIQYE